MICFIIACRFLPMEVDSKCLFGDLDTCGGSEIPCYYFYKPFTNAKNQSSLLGCKTHIESLILQYGKFDMLPCNVEEFHVCSDHSGLIYPSRFKNCCLCKSFGRTKCSKSGLRMITKLYAFVSWKKSKFVFHSVEKCARSAVMNLKNLI